MKSGLRIFVWCFGAMLIGFSSCENDVTIDPVAENVDQKNGTRAIVITTFIDEGCDVLLEIQENDKKVLLLPIELADQFKVEGLELLITFHSSRIMQSTCQIGRPIVIDQINFVD